MSKSDIFERYAEIALKEGLITNAEKESSEHKKYKNESHPRAGSDDISTIEALYGLKPKDIEYEYNIIEQAHPHPVVVAPSYDKLNGLVENGNERQSIIVDIVLKNPTSFGGHNQHKYAKQELLKQLVRIANDMDNKNQEDLRVLADNCLDKMSGKEEPIVKEALAPLVWAALIGATTVMGYLYHTQHMDNKDNGILQNIKTSIDSINSLTDDDHFWRSNLRPGFKNEMNSLKEDLETLLSETEDYLSLKDTISSPSNIKDMAKLSVHKEDAESKISNFKNHLMTLTPRIAQTSENLSREDYKNQQYESRTWLDKLRISDIFHGGGGLFADKFDALKQSLNPLLVSIESTLKSMNDAKKHVAKLQNRIIAKHKQVQSKHVDLNKQVNKQEPKKVEVKLPEKIEVKKPEVKKQEVKIPAEIKPSFDAPNIS